ncbi:UNVERIFIED_CONTAM: hypothetical protein Sradi_5671800 [Sesamum radiatum]|uniref:Uncharacterized protein n=1 Tax=Sesamum radiatum TaxID=300843 RepID=A0AAW2L0F2_SESRA
MITFKAAKAPRIHTYDFNGETSPAAEVEGVGATVPGVGAAVPGVGGACHGTGAGADAPGAETVMTSFIPLLQWSAMLQMYHFFPGAERVISSDPLVNRLLAFDATHCWKSLPFTFATV